MEESSGNTFANRDSPIPVVRFNRDSSEYSQSHENLSSPPSLPLTTVDSPGKTESRRWRFGQKIDRAKEIISSGREKDKDESADIEKEPIASKSFQDKILDKLLANIIPIDDDGSSNPADAYPGMVEKPNFSLPTMSTNFRRFNSRIGVIFVFQARVIRLLSWRKWSHTVSLLLVYTFICLDPSLLSVLPLAILLLGVFIPSFLARHPAPPIALTSSFEYSPRGPPIAPAPTVKPVKELSKDFFRNMRDLQNCMEDFSVVHDGVINLVGPKTNFSNEPLSSTLFVALFMSTAAMFIGSHLIPWRLVFLLGGWFIILSGHPKVARILSQAHKEHIEPEEVKAASWFENWINKDILLDSQPETREVEIFELQKLQEGTGEWEPWLYSASPYDPLSRERLEGGGVGPFGDNKPKGTRFFEDVKPPSGWEWEEKKWNLDMWSREWVEERIITGVEIETQGERWVYDIKYEDQGAGESMHGEGTGGKRDKVRDKGKEVKQVLKPTWEEGIEGQGKKGQWRRRRWVRLVKRKVVDKAADA